MITEKLCCPSLHGLPFPNPGDKTCTFSVPTAALCFLMLLLQQLETEIACVLTGDLKMGTSTDEPDACFVALP